MKDLKYYDIKLQQLRVFCDAAKYESFTKAADHLYTTQSFVSKTISNLENELGFNLFERSPRKVTLTVSGKIMYEYCLKIFSITEEYINKAENEINARSNCLIIGSDKTTRNDTYLFPIIENFTRKFPDVKVEIELLDPIPSIEGVGNGSFDICFTMLCNTQAFNEFSIEWKAIKECRHVAFIPQKLYPVKNGDVSVSDILQLPLIITSPPTNLDYYNKTMSIFYENGIKPHIKSLVSSNTTMLFLLHKGEGMVITNGFMDTGGDSSIIPYEIAETRDALIAFWRKNSPNPLVREFIRIAYDTMNK